ncbi:hypothetical protein PTKIN_Ptkin02bG0251100 [Pterospermum kingtungense]
MEPESMNEPCLRNWLELPRDLTASILLRLGTIEIIESAQNVCTQWHNICKDPSMWRSIDLRVPSDRYTNIDVEKMKKICMNAIDRSNGGLVDLNIEYIGTDELLSCVTQRTSHLRRLRLVFRWGISDDALSEAASKLPLLEELEIHCRPTCNNAIEVFGRRCPLLKTFKFSRWGFGYSSSDDEALAIAHHMHGLHHLHIVGSNLTNHGLKAILDGCPYLESLDLRRCLFVDLQGDMGKRCAQQMKNLRRPNDSIDDYEFAAELNRPDDDDYDYDGYYDDYSSDFSFDDDDGYMLDYGYDRLIYGFEDYIIYD